MPPLREFSGADKSRLNDVLDDALNMLDLKKVLQWTMKPPRKLSNYAGQGDNWQEVLFNVIEASVRENWTVELIIATRRYNPGNEGLKRLAEGWGIESGIVAQPSGSPLAREAIGGPDTSTSGIQNQWRVTTPPDRAWDPHREVPRRFERLVGLGQRLTALSSDSQQLFILLSKATEQLVRYQNLLTGGTAIGGGIWQLITYSLDNARYNVIEMRQTSVGVLEGPLADEFALQIVKLSTAAVVARGLGPEELPKVRARLGEMRDAAVVIRAMLKRQLVATLMGVIDGWEGEDLAADTDLLLTLWDQASRQYELWDKCWQTIVAIYYQVTAEFLVVIFEHAEEAVQASSEFRGAMATWSRPSAVGTDLRESAEVLRTAIEAASGIRRFGPEEIGEIKQIVTEAKDAAENLVAVILGMVNRWIEWLMQNASTRNGASGSFDSNARQESRYAREI